MRISTTGTEVGGRWVAGGGACACFHLQIVRQKLARVVSLQKDGDHVSEDTILPAWYLLYYFPRFNNFSPEEQVKAHFRKQIKFQRHSQGISKSRLGNRAFVFPPSEWAMGFFFLRKGNRKLSHPDFQEENSW